MSNEITKMLKQAWFIGTWPKRKLGFAFNTLKHYGETAGLRPPLSKATIVWLVIALIASTGLFLQLKAMQLHTDAAFMSAILLWATILWVTEAIPLFATGLSIIALEIIFISNPGSWPSFGTGSIPFQQFLSVFAQPVLALFLGGFILARGAVKEGIDQTLAVIVIRYIGAKPKAIMFGFMLITAVFSMWMSNTATTAMMLTLVVPLLANLSVKHAFSKGMLLSIPVAANIGGIATPTGSTPNAAALGFLANNHMALSFPQWMAAAVPFCIILLFIAFWVIWWFFKPKDEVVIKLPMAMPITMRGRYVIFVFVSTIGLWLTEPLHGLPAAVVSFWPVVAFTAGGLLDKNDINTLDWDLILLLAGGMALGYGVSATKLDTLLIPILTKHPQFLTISVIFLTLFISTFMSNTAAANLLIPLVGSIFITSGDIVAIVIAIAVVASLAMSLPVSTPPNALAFAKGGLKTKDFVKVGVVIGFSGFILAAFVLPYWIKLLRWWQIFD